ncbi:MAG TPA: RlmE family RNA methyltransferase [Burkholderiales bacterium]|nr:RlmE family RNA methyltransferase [Burkholderiales bacterium]
MARTRTSKAWMMQHVNDPYVKRASAEGMRSRAAYKLQQINEKDKLIKPGMLVVDLGATPGGWSQVAGRIVAPAGRVIAIDLLEMAPLAGVTFIRGDFSEAEGLAALEQELAGAPADLVLSDMAPNISGIALADQSRLMGLVELALDFSIKHLKPQGNFLVKVFHGAGFDGYVNAMRSVFKQVQTRKPDASRKGSREVYVLGKGLKMAEHNSETH